MAGATAKPSSNPGHEAWGGQDSANKRLSGTLTCRQLRSQAAETVCCAMPLICSRASSWTQSRALTCSKDRCSCSRLPDACGNAGQAVERRQLMLRCLAVGTTFLRALSPCLGPPTGAASAPGPAPTPTTAGATRVLHTKVPRYRYTASYNYSRPNETPVEITKRYMYTTTAKPRAIEV